MTQDQKLRFVGLIAIIVSAAVLFPLLLDGEGYRERHLNSEIPEEPPAPVVIAVKPLKPKIEPTVEIAPVAESEKLVQIQRPAVVEKAVQKTKPVVNIEAEPPTLDQQGVPVAWTLQLASFKDETNARGLRKQLVTAGHKVYTRKQKGLVKVFVGPDLQRSNLERLKKDLKENMGMDGIIVRFTTQ